MFLVGTYLHSGKVFFQENISAATSHFRQKETFFCTANCETKFMLQKG